MRTLWLLARAWVVGIVALVLFGMPYGYVFAALTIAAFLKLATIG